MTPLGKPLVFHLKYMAEMNRLYGHPEDEEPDLTGLDDVEHVLETARAVGAAAYEQAADFLELCGKGIEDHFTGLGATVTNKRKRSGVLTDWYWWSKVWIPSVPGGCFEGSVGVSAPPEIRVSLDKDTCGVVVPYLSSKGGRKGEDAIWNILGGWPHSRGIEGILGVRGMVALACIPIKAQPPDSFDVDRDPLVAEVRKTFARIDANQIKAIASFVAGLKKSEED